MTLFRLKYFNECLTDINRALILPCPKMTMERLLVKKVRCMKILNHPDLRAVYKDSLDWMDKNSTDVKKIKAKVEKAFQNDKVPVCETPINIKFRDDLFEEMKKSCPNLNKVEIGRNSIGDLILVAAKDIHVGEVVAAEKMYTQVLHLDQEDGRGYLACWHCIMMCLNPIPCDGCTAVVYCSESCKAEAWGKYHEYECSIMHHVFDLISTYEVPYRRNETIANISIPIKICMMAIKQLGGIIPLMEEVRKLSQTDDPTKEHRIVDGVYPSESYRSVYNMLKKRYESNAMAVNEIPVNERCYSFIISGVYMLATRTNFFEKKYQGDISTVMQKQLPKFFASLIIKHFQLFKDAQQFASIEQNYTLLKSSAVCPLLFILNHSCNPNSTKFMLKDHQLLVAINEIKKGQEINVSFFGKILDGESDLQKIDNFIIKFDRFGSPCDCEVCCVDFGLSTKLYSLQLLEDEPYFGVANEIYDKILKTIFFHSLPKPRSTPEFLKWTADLYKDFQ